jgi:hypothetical protein
MDFGFYYFTKRQRRKTTNPDINMGSQLASNHLITQIFIIHFSLTTQTQNTTQHTERHKHYVFKRWLRRIHARWRWARQVRPYRRERGKAVRGWSVEAGMLHTPTHTQTHTHTGTGAGARTTQPKKKKAVVKKAGGGGAKGVASTGRVVVSASTR